MTPWIAETMCRGAFGPLAASFHSLPRMATTVKVSGALGRPKAGDPGEFAFSAYQWRTLLGRLWQARCFCTMSTLESPQEPLSQIIDHGKGSWDNDQA